MTTHLLALSARKQGGKGTLYQLVEALNQGIRPTKEFGFSDPLKRMCVEILGLEHRQCFGSDQDKNSIVPHILWENFPIPAWEWPDGTIEVAPKRPYRISFRGLDHGPPYRIDVRPRTGPMTGRQVLQYWGTEIFRRQYATVWADATIRRADAWLASHPSGVAVITDCRFGDEVDATLGAGGAVGRLTRVAFPDDNHGSETALDRDVFDWGRFSFVLDNADLDVYGTCMRAYPVLRGLGVVPQVEHDLVSHAAALIAAPERERLTMGVAS